MRKSCSERDGFFCGSFLVFSLSTKMVYVRFAEFPHKGLFGGVCGNLWERWGVFVFG